MILGFITISVLAAAGDSIINIIGNTYENTLKCFMIQCMNKCIFINPELVLISKISEYPTIFLMDFTMYITVSSLGVLIGALFIPSQQNFKNYNSTKSVADFSDRIGYYTFY